MPLFRSVSFRCFFPDSSTLWFPIAFINPDTSACGGSSTFNYHMFSRRGIAYQRFTCFTFYASFVENDERALRQTRAANNVFVFRAEPSDRP